MHSHTVFFWLNDGLSLDAISDFEKGLVESNQNPI